MECVSCACAEGALGGTHSSCLRTRDNTEEDASTTLTFPFSSVIVYSMLPACWLVPPVFREGLPHQ